MTTRYRLQRRFVSSATALATCQRDEFPIKLKQNFLFKSNKNLKSSSTCGGIHELTEIRQALRDEGEERCQKRSVVKVLSFGNDELVCAQNVLCSVLHGFDRLHVLHQPKPNVKSAQQPRELPQTLSHLMRTRACASADTAGSGGAVTRRNSRAHSDEQSICNR